MYEHIRNEVTQEFLIKKVKEISKTYGKALLKVVLFKAEDSIYLYYGKINFLHKSEKESSNFSNDYGGIILVQWVIEIEKLLKFIESLSSEFKSVITKGGFAQEFFHVSSRYNFGGVFNEWPFWFSRYDCESSGAVHYQNAYDALTGTGLDPYPNLYEASKIFLNLDENPNENRPIGIQFIIPDYRARIKTVEIADTQVTISIESKETTIDNLLLQFYCSNDNDAHSLKEVKIEQNDTAKITIPFEPKEGHIFLLEKNSGVRIDSKSFGRWHTERTEGVIFKTSKETVENMIAKGESDAIEFKMDFGKDNNDFLETVSSFANTKGGTILLGVHNDGRIVGVVDDFEKIDKKVRGLVANRCEPDIEIDVESFLIEGRDIVAVSVKEGKDKPYLVIDKSAYKRVIKDDYVLRRRDFDEMYSKRQQRPEGSGIAY